MGGCVAPLRPPRLRYCILTESEFSTVVTVLTVAIQTQAAIKTLIYLQHKLVVEVERPQSFGKLKLIPQLTGSLQRM